jgi:hypothetical protein
MTSPRTTSTRQLVSTAPQRAAPVTRIAQPVGRFTLHLLEMCLVMCASAVLLSVLFFQAAAWLGYSDLPRTAPELSVLVIAFNLSVPMALWMRIRRMGWRPTLEMAGATAATGLLLIAGYWLDVVPGDRLIETQTSLACPVMVVVMLARFRLYAGHTGHPGGSS